MTHSETNGSKRFWAILATAIVTAGGAGGGGAYLAGSRTTDKAVEASTETIKTLASLGNEVANLKGYLSEARAEMQARTTNRYTSLDADRDLTMIRTDVRALQLKQAEHDRAIDKLQDWRDRAEKKGP